MCDRCRVLLEQDLPRAHLVMDDFFGPDALREVFRELARLEPTLKAGLVREIGHDGQSVFFAHRRRQNRAVWMHDPSPTIRLFRERFWADDLVAAFDGAREPLFQVIPECSAPNLQFSSYMTGDHYDFHEDEGAGVNMTVIVFLALAPEKVRGGDLVLSYEGEEVRIPFRHNRLVVFPSKTLHRVTKVKVDSEDPRHARISLQCWLTPGRQERAPAERAPEADRPTFLLAEPAIVRSAQGLLANGTQSPEDLYWGAFYTSRILVQNLGALAAACELTIGRIRIRRGERLEVAARTGDGRRIGFALAGPDREAAEALRIFVVRDGVRRSRRLLPEADEKRAVRILRRLLD